MKKYTYHKLIILLFFAFTSSSCFDLVDEGIKVDYPLSDATISVEPIGPEKGAINETISYQITVSSNTDIKSCIVQSNNPGQNGTGFNVSAAGFDDPFADHTFGTVQKNTQSFTVRYDYIIPEEVSKNRLTFSIIDESGKVSTERTVEVVPGIEVYTDLSLYAKNEDFNDALATVDGMVYADIKTNYSAVSEENRKVQEQIDIIFYYDTESKRSVITSPASDRLGLNLNIENNTMFKKLSGLGDIDLTEVTPASLIELTEEVEILKNGSGNISNIVVGDMIGFITDLNAVYSLKTGILKVKGLHPASVPQYSGVSYVLECDVIVQK